MFQTIFCLLALIAPLAQAAEEKSFIIPQLGFQLRHPTEWTSGGPHSCRIAGLAFTNAQGENGHVTFFDFRTPGRKSEGIKSLKIKHDRLREPATLKKLELVCQPAFETDPPGCSVIGRFKVPALNDDVSVSFGLEISQSRVPRDGALAPDAKTLAGKELETALRILSTMQPVPISQTLVPCR